MKPDTYAGHHAMQDDGGKPKPKLDKLAVSQIGQKLRAEFDAVLNEPVPDRFRELLERLETAEKTSPKDKSDE